MSPLTGQLAALGTSIAFALCSVAFASAGRRVGALAVNQARIYVAVIVMGGIAVATTGEFWPVAFFSQQSLYILLSGFVGVVLGDLALFQSFAMVGPRLGTLVMATSPAITALLAWSLLDESLSWPAIYGMSITLAGVLWVVSERREAAAWKPVGSGRGTDRSHYSLALLYALIGAVGQAGGLVLVKLADQAGDEIDTLQVTFMRLFAGACGVFVIAIGSGKLGVLKAAFRDRVALLLIGLGTLAGPTIGIWLSMVAVLESKSTGEAATLSALSPIVMLPLAWFAYGLRPSVRATVGTLVAVAGTVMLVSK